MSKILSFTSADISALVLCGYRQSLRTLKRCQLANEDLNENKEINEIRALSIYSAGEASFRRYRSAQRVSGDAGVELSKSQVETILLEGWQTAVSDADSLDLLLGKPYKDKDFKNAMDAQITKHASDLYCSIEQPKNTPQMT